MHQSMIRKSGNRFSEKIMLHQRARRQQSNLKAIVLQSMIPKSGNRFSDKTMLKTKNLDRDPIN
jgi:hypothetical protein